VPDRRDYVEHLFLGAVNDDLDLVILFSHDHSPCLC
jgi:hypothetical protein